MLIYRWNPPFACLMQLADRIFIIAKGVLFVRIIDTSLFWNPSPSEWFSLYKNSGQPFWGCPQGDRLPSSLDKLEFVSLIAF